MSGKFLLDTNIVIAIFAGDSSVQARLAQANEVYVPSIVLGELYFGAHKSGRVTENVTRVDAYAAGSTVLACTEATAQEYGVIKKELRDKGRPLPENDIWIAAIGRQWELTLVTNGASFRGQTPQSRNGLAVSPVSARCPSAAAP